MISLINYIPVDIEHNLFFLLALFMGWKVLQKMHTKKKLRSRNIDFSILYEANGDALMLLDTTGFFECNKATLSMFGCATHEEFCTKHPADLSPKKQPCGGSSLKVAKKHMALAANNGSHRFEWIHRRIDNGETFPAEVTFNTLQFDGKPVLRAMVRDITERKQSEAELQLAATILESRQGMIITDANNIILRVNRTFITLTGYTKEEAIGKSTNFLKSGRHDNDFYRAMWSSLNNAGYWSGEIWNRRKNGEIYPEYLIITAVKDQEDHVVNYVATFNDITLSKQAADKIERLAFYDQLTNLPNRQLLLDRLVTALALSYRKDRRGALLVIDMDNFKTLNDALGHDMGNLMLQQSVQRLQSTVRESDTIARLGGDEFAVMLVDLNSDALKAAAQAEVIGYEILDALNQYYQLGDHKYHSTPSIGATLFKGHEHSSAELLKQAEIAMNRGKALGRNTLCFYDHQMQTNLTARVALEAELHLAVTEHQFELYYQPQVSHNQHIIGAEALIRWQHPQRGFVSPGDFIPLAEETGLILPIGQWVLETACARLKIWEESMHTRLLQLAVNVSARQFHQPNFAEQVILLLRRYDINPARLKLELTETMVLDNVDDILIKMKMLKKIGVRFSMDDFGTGHSSLSILKKLPFDQLKVDQSFVHDISIDQEDEVIVKTIIQMASNLGMEIIAEGVETEVQRDFLEQNNCLYYQGYLFSKPVPIEQFEALLKRN